MRILVAIFMFSITTGACTKKYDDVEQPKTPTPTNVQKVTNEKPTIPKESKPTKPTGAPAGIGVPKTSDPIKMPARPGLTKAPVAVAQNTEPQQVTAAKAADDKASSTNRSSLWVAQERDSKKYEALVVHFNPELTQLIQKKFSSFNPKDNCIQLLRSFSAPSAKKDTMEPKFDGTVEIISSPCHEGPIVAGAKEPVADLKFSVPAGNAKDERIAEIFYTDEVYAPFTIGKISLKFGRDPTAQLISLCGFSVGQPISTENVVDLDVSGAVIAGLNPNFPLMEKEYAKSLTILTNELKDARNQVTATMQALAQQQAKLKDANSTLSKAETSLVRQNLRLTSIANRLQKDRASLAQVRIDLKEKQAELEKNKDLTAVERQKLLEYIASSESKADKLTKSLANHKKSLAAIRAAHRQALESLKKESNETENAKKNLESADDAAKKQEDKLQQEDSEADKPK